MGHEKGLEDGVRRVERGECTKRHWRIGEVGGVEVNSKDLVDASETGGGSRHAIGGRDEAVLVFVPRRRAREKELNCDTKNAHPSKGSGEDWGRSRGTENEHD